MGNTSKRASSRSAVTATAGKYPKFAERLIVQMEAHHDNDDSLGKAVGVTQQAINQYRNKISFPKMETLLRMADYFKCSVNYLTGISDVPSPDTRIEFICEYTGLSEESVKLLHLITQSKIKESTRTIRFLNTVLSDPRLVRIDDAFPIETPFSLMDQYVDADNVRLSSKYKEAEGFRHLVALESSEDMTESESVSKLYKQLKIEEIKEQLNHYQKERAGESK